MWPIIKYTMFGKLGAFLIGAAPLIFAVEMESHIDAIISAIPPTIAVIIGVISLRKGQKTLMVSVDGKMEQLLQVTKKEAHSAGMTEERKDEQARVLEARPKNVVVVNTADDPAQTEVTNDPSRPVPTLDQQQKRIDKAQARLDKDVEESKP